jgi:hypothetical protein
MPGATTEAGTANSSENMSSLPVCCGLRVVQSLSFYIVFLGSLFVKRKFKQ